MLKEMVYISGELLDPSKPEVQVKLLRRVAKRWRKAASIYPHLEAEALIAEQKYQKLKAQLKSGVRKPLRPKLNRL